MHTRLILSLFACFLPSAAGWVRAMEPIIEKEEDTNTDFEEKIDYKDVDDQKESINRGKGTQIKDVKGRLSRGSRQFSNIESDTVVAIEHGAYLLGGIGVVGAVGSCTYYLYKRFYNPPKSTLFSASQPIFSPLMWTILGISILLLIGGVLLYIGRAWLAIKIDGDDIIVDEKLQTRLNVDHL